MHMIAGSNLIAVIVFTRDWIGTTTANRKTGRVCQSLKRIHWSDTLSRYAIDSFFRYDSILHALTSHLSAGTGFEAA